MTIRESIIRRADQKDIASIYALGESGLGFVRTLDDLLKESASERVILAVMCLEGTGVVGYVNGWWAADELELTEIVVNLDHRKKGYGRRLIDWLVEHAVEQGGRIMHLEVRSSNASAIRLYTRMGFVKVGRRREYYRDGEDACLYSLELSGGSGVS